MRLLTILLVAALAACSSSAPSKAVSADEAGGLLIDRNWLDRMPETERDRLFVYRFVPNMGGGVFQDRTLFKGTFELFSFTADGARIRFVLHETKQDVTSPFTIEPIDGPAPFDLKLTIPEDPRGPKVYYGIRAETDRDGTRLQARLSSISPAR
ncbi:MAG TPA: hypothetical protein VK932_01715 [Kofleriaceae bacterium]|nr:hypothetical protein [Kofleriaceae bacterium]